MEACYFACWMNNKLVASTDEDGDDGDEDESST